MSAFADTVEFLAELPPRTEFRWKLISDAKHRTPSRPNSVRLIEPRGFSEDKIDISLEADAG